MGESFRADSRLHPRLERGGFDRRGHRRRTQSDPGGRPARHRRRLHRRHRRAGAGGGGAGRLAPLQPGPGSGAADRLPLRAAQRLRRLRPPRRRRPAPGRGGGPPARRGDRRPRRPRARLPLPRRRRRRQRRLPADLLAADRDQRLPLLPHPGDAAALHRHDQRHARRQPPRDGALQPALLARLRGDRVAAAGGAAGAAGRGAAGADAGAGRRQLLPDPAALGLLHLQGPRRPPRRPVPPAPHRGRVMGLVLAAEAGQVHLTSQTRIVAAVLALVFMLMILELIRRDRLQERYSVIWFVAGMGMLAGAAFPGLLEVFANLMGVRNTNVALFSIVLLLLLGLALNFSVIMSRQAAQITRLAQERAIEKALAEKRAEGANGNGSSGEETLQPEEQSL